MRTAFHDQSGGKKKMALVVLSSLLLVFAFSFFALSAEKPEGKLSIVEIIRTGEHETVLVLNRTRKKIDLCGYVLKEEKGDAVFDFGKEADCKTIIPPLSIIRIHSGTGSSSYYASWQDLPWSQEEVWGDTEDKATLINPHGEVISTFAYGPEMEESDEDTEEE